MTTPEELWPFTGLWRLVGLALGPPSVWGLGGSAWPDEPWWKLSGLFDLTVDHRCRPGWLIWNGRWPSTATTIW